MKYTSRLTALLLALMMLLSSVAGAETLALDATKQQLDAMYAAVQNNETVYVDTNLLGEWAQLDAFTNLANKDQYSFQWYDANGNALSYGTSNTVFGTFTMQEQQLYCIATDANGMQYRSATYVIPAADISDPDAYVGFLYDLRFISESGGFDSLSVYKLMTQDWNVMLDSGKTLAQTVLEIWWSESGADYFRPYLLCSCVIDGKVTSDSCILHPNSSEHDASCGWALPNLIASKDVTKPELLVEGDVIELAPPSADVDARWQKYTYNAETNNWEWVSVATTNTYSVEVSAASVRDAYRVTCETDVDLYETPPFYLGGQDFFNWIYQNLDIWFWIETGNVTLAQVVAKYNEFIAGDDEEDRTNAKDYTYGEAGDSVNLKVSEGVFEEDYVMEIEPIVPTETVKDAVLKSMDATGTATLQVLQAFDISFASLADRSNKLQPAAGKSVALTFEVSTAGVPTDDTYYLYVYHIADNGKPEVVAGPVQVAYGVQQVPVEATEFSNYIMVATNDYCAFCSHYEYCVYEDLLTKDPALQWAYLQELSEEDRSNYLLDYAAHIEFGAIEIICTCVSGLHEPDQTHEVNCPWHLYYNVLTDVLGAEYTMSVTIEGEYSWYLGDKETGTPLEVTTATLTGMMPLEPETYTCVVSQEENEYIYTFKVVAQTTALVDYIDFLDTMLYQDLNNEVTFETYVDKAVAYMNETWNKDITVTTYEGEGADQKEVVTTFNLAEKVLEYWYQNITSTATPSDLLCSCVVSNKAVSSNWVLTWNEVHATDCLWYHGTPVVKLYAETDENGEVLYYSLYLDLVDENGFWYGYGTDIAVSSMLDGKYHYFQDVDTGLYVAYLHEAEDGEMWIVPLKSENQPEEEIPAN